MWQSIVYYMRLSLKSRAVEIRCTAEALEICDGAGLIERWPLEDVLRLAIAHDGAPARIAIDAGSKRYRWTIGQLYRHNRVERLVAEVPERAILRLQAAGIEPVATMRRGVLFAEYRRP